MVVILNCCISAVVHAVDLAELLADEFSLSSSAVYNSLVINDNHIVCWHMLTLI